MREVDGGVTRPLVLHGGQARINVERSRDDQTTLDQDLGLSQQQADGEENQPQGGDAGEEPGEPPMEPEEPEEGGGDVDENNPPAPDELSTDMMEGEEGGESPAVDDPAAVAAVHREPVHGEPAQQRPARPTRCSGPSLVKRRSWRSQARAWCAIGARGERTRTRGRYPAGAWVRAAAHS